VSGSFSGRVDYAIQSTLSTFDESLILAAGVVGSTARGYFDAHSDIDVLLVSEAELPEFTTFQTPYELTISTVPRDWFLPYELKTNFDFSELRVISDLSSAYPFVDKIGFFDSAKRVNKTATLREDIQHTMHEQVADSLCLLASSANAIERKLLTSQVVNISTTLILANSHIRLTKPRWAWRSLLELNPSYCDLVSTALKLPLVYSRVKTSVLHAILEVSVLDDEKEGVNKNYLRALLKHSESSSSSLESAYIKDLLINWFLKNEVNVDNQVFLEELKSIVTDIYSSRNTPEELNTLLGYTSMPLGLGSV
jgi:predicted nucleotidyltransferase